MMLALSLSLGPSPLIAVSKVIMTSAIPSAGRMAVRITAIDPQLPGRPSLEALTIDGESLVGTVADAISQELALIPDPGRVSGTDTPVSALIAPLEIGVAYVVSYEITSTGRGASLVFPVSGGPFPAGPLPVTSGRHAQVFVAETTDTQALMAVTGRVTFAEVSCRKAEWSFDIPPPLGPEQAANPAPGMVSGNGVNVSGLTGPLVVGEDYVLAYEITQDEGNNGLYSSANNGSPFASAPFPHTVGAHAVTLTAVDGDTGSVARVSGALTFAYFSVRRVLPPAARKLAWTVKVGEQTVRGAYNLLDGVLLFNGEPLLLNNEQIHIN
jgi:hypothetical protein